NLPTQQRLDLFMKVCQAIQHAHQKGIIHRDIKPSNILVTVNDGVAVPKVIDFGIAKATTDQRLTDKTVFTAFEQFISTPAYMSPEQAEITSVDVDTRSDIYSLGVLVYELLTGKTPFDPKELLQAGLDEMRRTIREKEPARPSTRVSTLGADELTTTAKRRGVEPPGLAHMSRGDLDWTVSFISIALICGAGVSAWQAIRARHAEQEQLRLRKEAVSKQTEAQQIAQFLKEMLQGAGPEVAKGRDASILVEILNNTADRVS